MLVGASGLVLDREGLRELIAGVEVELGEERAKTEAVKEQLRIERENASREKISAALGGGFIGALISAVIVLAVTGAK